MRTVVYTLVASAALNTAGLLLVDRSIESRALKLEVMKQEMRARAARENIFFDFIESPSVLQPQSPQKRPRRVSNKDSASQDLLKDKAGKEGPPASAETGPADQLSQIRPNPDVQPDPSRLVKARPETQRAEPSPPVEAPKKETAPSLEPPGSETPAPKPETAHSEEGFPAMKEKEAPPAPAEAAVKPSAPESPVTQKAQPEIKPRAGSQALSGIDRISTREMTKAKSKGARLFGITSFDAMGSDMGVYMKNLKEKVWLSWYPYLAFQYPTDFHAADATVSFMLNAKGEIKQVKLLDSYGSPVFSAFCIEAVQRASGFGPVPKEILALLGKEEIEIKFAFHYR